VSGATDQPDLYAGFDTPYVDIDEWRDAPCGHRYVHGGFSGTETRFSVYLPPPELYQGRFFQHFTPVPDSENLAQHATGAQDKIGFSIASGGYFLETNGGGVFGGLGSPDPTVAAYRANAAAARSGRAIAAQMYGEHRPYGYAYGGSGGGYRTIGAAENTQGVWDGFVPYVIGSPMAIPNMFTVRMHAQRILRHHFDRIVDALEPGGSGDMFDGLDEDERAALTEVTRMGFPPRSWFGYRTMGMHAFPVLYQGMAMADPSYFEDFWTVPGYLGHDMPSSFERDRLQLECEITAVLTESDALSLGLPVGPQPGLARGGVDTAWRGSDEPPTVPVAVRLSRPTTVDVQGAELVVSSGGAAGTRLLALSVAGDVAVLGPGDPDALTRLAPGDAVRVDNSGFLAAQTYHRHQVPETDDFPVWDQFRNPDGSPVYPQRPLVLGPLFTSAAAGSVQTGRITSKMIVVASLLDREALPWQADWYRTKVGEHLGSAVDEQFRLWFTDNALHGDDEIQESPAHTVSYLGVLHQALRDLSRWVEQGVPPPASTSYEVLDGQVVVPDEARRRGGIQPVISLTADGRPRTDIVAGAHVRLHAVAEVPGGVGAIVGLEWDLDGTGDFPESEVIEAATRVTIERLASFATPGVYFPTVRVVAQRDGDPTSPYGRIQNVARVRVVVGN